MPRNILHRLVDKIAQKLLGPAAYAAVASPPGDDIRYWLGQTAPGSGATTASRGAQAGAGPSPAPARAGNRVGAGVTATGSNGSVRPRPIMAIR